MNFMTKNDITTEKMKDKITVEKMIAIKEGKDRTLHPQVRITIPNAQVAPSMIFWTDITKVIGRNISCKLKCLKEWSQTGGFHR